MALDMVTSELDRDILRLLAAGETRSEPIARALGVTPRTVRRGLDRLVIAHLVESPSRGTWRLTVAGGRAAVVATVPEPAAASADLGALPAEHQALLRLVEDAVVARRALRTVHPSNWPGFVLLGPTKSGKTFLGRLAARRFGIDPDEAIVRLMRETKGSLLGRREQTGPGTWRMEPSPYLALPLVVLDEYDKASPELRPATFAYLEGSSHYRAEGDMFEVTATTIITLNAERDPSRLLPDAYLRRAVVLDTTPLRAATRDLDVVVARLERADLPRIADDLAPPGDALAEDAIAGGPRDALRLLLQTCLTERGWELVDVEAISRLVLGRWATLPADLPAAVLGVVADYLLVSATRSGIVESDWPARIEAVVGAAVTPIATTLATARDRRAAVVDREADVKRAAFAVSLDLAGTRERLLHRLDSATRSTPTRTRAMTAPERESFADVRGKAQPLRDAVSKARSLEALAGLEVIIESAVLTPVRTILGAIEARSQAAARAKVDAARAKAEIAARAKAEIAARRTLRIKLQDLAGRTTTRPAEDVLAALIAAGCLTERREDYQEETLGSIVWHGVDAGVGAVRHGVDVITGAVRTPKPAPPSPPPAMIDPWAARLPGGLPVPPVPSGPPRYYETKTRIWYEDRGRHKYAAGELVAWGSEPVRAVLVAAAAAEGLRPLTFPKPKAAPARKKTAARTR